MEMAVDGVRVILAGAKFLLPSKKHGSSQQLFNAKAPAKTGAVGPQELE